MDADELGTLLGVKARSTVWVFYGDGYLPAYLQLGSRRVWVVYELRRYLAHSASRGQLLTREEWNRVKRGGASS